MNLTKIDSILLSLTGQEIHELYHTLRKKYVTEDIKAYCMDNNVPITGKEIDLAAYLYAVECKYDCTLSYWDNIEAVIDIAKEYARTGHTS